MRAHSLSNTDLSQITISFSLFSMVVIDWGGDNLGLKIIGRFGGDVGDVHGKTCSLPSHQIIEQNVSRVLLVFLQSRGFLVGATGKRWMFRIVEGGFFGPGGGPKVRGSKVGSRMVSDNGERDGEMNWGGRAVQRGKEEQGNKESDGLNRARSRDTWSMWWSPWSAKSLRWLLTFNFSSLPVALPLSSLFGTWSDVDLRFSCNI